MSENLDYLGKTELDERYFQKLVTSKRRMSLGFTNPKISSFPEQNDTKIGTKKRPYLKFDLETGHLGNRIANLNPMFDIFGKLTDL